ncbi:DUF3054 domain-containing protein [Nocardiopsis sp. LOL_012]|uniref:DUF3054 domain-containing protein n=1 Tax=Nocardiopsis sp. LOL_012 TaxID=3345409 RepID=UPI003A86E75E
MRSFTAPLAFVADLVCVLAFVLIGRTEHESGTALGAVLGTAWPFAAALALGWALTLAWRSPARLWPTGVFVWAVAVAGGMVARLATGEDAPYSFVVVTGVFLAATMLGWRGLAHLVVERREKRHQAA